MKNYLKPAVFLILLWPIYVISYEIILNRYEDSAKLADAMYGLGLAYQGLGNVTQARQLLNEIKRRFPNTGVANLADTKLLQLD